uniref:Uncharacterized protein n=1 Tax=Tetranychus urticae TaxID=32264 RepID=T1KRW9_TETUR
MMVEVNVAGDDQRLLEGLELVKSAVLSVGANRLTTSLNLFSKSFTLVSLITDESCGEDNNDGDESIRGEDGAYEDNIRRRLGILKKLINGIKTNPNGRLQ